MNTPVSLAESARMQLEALINDGVLMPGDPIDERALAARFGVSRTPVREAVQQLQVQGLVQVMPRQGVYVARMSIKSLLGMFELLAELESVCAKLAARRIGAEGRQALARALEACRAAALRDDAKDYSAANAEFHGTVYEASNNRFLVEQLLLIRRRTQMYRRNAFEQRGRMQTSLEDHERIASAILAGQADQAAAEALAHIAVGGKGFAEFVSTLPDGMVQASGGEPSPAVRPKVPLAALTPEAETAAEPRRGRQTAMARPSSEPARPSHPETAGSPSKQRHRSGAR